MNAITLTCMRMMATRENNASFDRYRMTVTCLRTFERYGHTFGLHVAAGRDMNAYTVSESSTGYMVACGETPKTAMLAARAVLDSVGEAKARDVFQRRKSELDGLGELPHVDARGRTGMDVRVGPEGIYRVHHRIPADFARLWRAEGNDDRITHVCVMTKPRGRAAVIGYEDESGDVSLHLPSPITYLQPRKEVA